MPVQLGARGTDGYFVMVGKTVKGLTDDLLRLQTKRFMSLKITAGTGRGGHVVGTRVASPSVSPGSGNTATTSQPVKPTRSNWFKRCTDDPAAVGSRLDMATLRFSFGTMGSGKSTLALQIHHNLSSRHLYGLLLTRLDREGHQVTSRLGVAAPAVQVDPDLDIHALAIQHWPLHYLVCDEVQFYTVAQCEQLGRVVDDMEVDVYAFGLITDFRGLLFEGTKRMLEISDERVPLQVEARCWCGARATHNARVVNDFVVYEGETVVVGDTADPSAQKMFGDTVRYELLCRRHYNLGEIGN